MRSVSLPSAETDWYFSVTLIEPTKQPLVSHAITPLPIFVLLTEPDTWIATNVPAQTGM